MRVDVGIGAGAWGRLPLLRFSPSNMPPRAGRGSIAGVWRIVGCGVLRLICVREERFPLSKEKPGWLNGEGLVRKPLLPLLGLSPPFIQLGELERLGSAWGWMARLCNCVRCDEFIQEEEPALLTRRAHW